MAKTAQMIDLDYQNALRQAARLEEAAKKVKKERSNLHDCGGSVASAWKGTNASAYVKKVRVVENDLSRIERNLKDAAETIRTIAKETYEAEQRALKLAKARKV